MAFRIVVNPLTCSQPARFVRQHHPRNFPNQHTCRSVAVCSKASARGSAQWRVGAFTQPLGSRGFIRGGVSDSGRTEPLASREVPKLQFPYDAVPATGVQHRLRASDDTLGAFPRPAVFRGAYTGVDDRT